MYSLRRSFANVDACSRVKKTKIIFACVGNSCRSQMAEGFAKNKLHDDPDIEIISAGTQPSSQVNAVAVQVMAEKGIDISAQFPKPFTRNMLVGATHFISMGCGVLDSCPFPLVKGDLTIEDWELEDPAGKDVATFRTTRDTIERRVDALLKTILEK